ncbi:MAG: hypothetical protein PQJ60_05265 [Spirochaetales bacterium]|nr:hypothetical protein [Spirochaetales bacterium]
MKRMKYLALFMLILGALASCDLFNEESSDTQTKSACLSAFFSNAQSGNWTSMYQQIHPDNTNYDNYKSGTAFSSLMTTDADYSVTSSSGDSWTVSCDYTGTGSYTSETFTFEEDGSDYWLILSFTSGSTTF